MNDELFGIRDMLGFVPYIGDALDIADIGKDISKGNYGKAAIGLGLLAVPNVVEKPLKLIGRKAIRKLSDAEKLGIPKGERKSPSPYQVKGTADEVTDKTMKVSSPEFGSFIDKRSEQAVFNHATDPTKVIKVYAVNENGFPNIEAIREFHKHFMKRNQIPFTVKNKFSGYLKGENGIFPYYIQDKVKPLSPMNNTQYEKKLLPRLTKQLETKGYKPIGSDAYSNGKFTITDLTEENMALDNNGNFIFFDPRVYFWGGTLHKRNFRTLNALI